MWQPLGNRVFRAMFLAATVSNFGTWMQNVAAAWEMTRLSASSLLVAMVQVATTLPVCLLAIPAGAMADILDRRRLLLAAQGWQLLAAAALAAFAFTGQVNPAVLLAGTFLIGVGAAITSPAWQAVTGELVPPEQVPAAVGLNGFSLNAARAVGPAVGGWVVAAMGTGAAFLLNAISFLAVLVVVARWRSERRTSALPAEQLVGAMRVGVRYVRHSPEVRAVLVRALAFVAGASGLWALLPAVVATDPTLGPGDYGTLLGCLGAGALVGVFLLSWLRSIMGDGFLLTVAAAVFAVAAGVVALVPVFLVWCAVLVPAGVAWICALTLANSTVQAVIPKWVRGRVLSVYLLVFFGGMAAGSFGWGALGDAVGPITALLASAGATLLALLAAVLFPLPLPTAGDTDLVAWPDLTHLGPTTDPHPVVVTVEYRVAEHDRDKFRAAAVLLRESRYRNGACRWELAEDMERQGVFRETFAVESWTEHLRQHERQTEADEEAHRAVWACHTGPEPPTVTHWRTEWV
jgi:MFS family permease